MDNAGATDAKTRPGEDLLRGWTLSCDFDGTITCVDVVQAMLQRFATPEWRQVESEWEQGAISAQACLQRQTGLLRVSPARLREWIDDQAVDHDARGFFVDCAAASVPVRILSDGYDWVIRRVMRRLGLEHVRVFANHLEPAGDDRWRVSFPFAKPGCQAGACKCSAAARGRLRLHIGDGRSDVCVSDACDLVFAKGWLLADRLRRNRPTRAFRDFADLRACLPEFASVERGRDSRQRLPDDQLSTIS